MCNHLAIKRCIAELFELAKIYGTMVFIFLYFLFLFSACAYFIYLLCYIREKIILEKIILLIIYYIIYYIREKGSTNTM